MQRVQVAHFRQLLQPVVVKAAAVIFLQDKRAVQAAAEPARRAEPVTKADFHQLKDMQVEAALIQRQIIQAAAVVVPQPLE